MKLRRAVRRRLQAFRSSDLRGSASTGPGPIFVGGTGRSGTTITGRLLGAHPSLHMIVTEVRFITHRGALCDLVRGKTTWEAFEEQVLGFWFERGPHKGLHVLMERSAIEAALPELKAGLARDPWTAARVFTHRLLDPVAAAAGAAGWVEMSPTNVRRGPVLERMFPDMRLIHSVRDGRDVACSVARFAWGPDDVDEALDWWARKLEGAFTATDQLPAERSLTLQLEDLVIRDRERQYARLLAFVGLADDPAMRAFFDERLTADGSHTGRWRRDVPSDRVAAFDAHHGRLAAELASRGRPYVPMALSAELAPA